jgi:hypothetical protein
MGHLIIRHTGKHLFSEDKVNITFPDDNFSIYNLMENPKNPSSAVYYDQLARILERNEHQWAELVPRVALAFNDMLDGVSEISPNPYKKVHEGF